MFPCSIFAEVVKGILGQRRARLPDVVTSKWWAGEESNSCETTTFIPVPERGPCGRFFRPRMPETRLASGCSAPPLGGHRAKSGPVDENPEEVAGLLGRWAEAMGLEGWQ